MRVLIDITQFIFIHKKDAQNEILINYVNGNLSKNLSFYQRNVKILNQNFHLNVIIAKPNLLNFEG